MPELLDATMRRILERARNEAILKLQQYVPDITDEQAQQILDSFRTNYPEFESWLEWIRAEHIGYAKTIHGRKRYFEKTPNGPA